MMLPVSRFKGQPAGMVTTTMPWLSVSNEPTTQWLCLASWSSGTYQAMPPPLVCCPPMVWIPDHTPLIKWEHPAVEVIPLLPPFYRSSPLNHPHHLPKFVEGWSSPEEVGVFQRRDKHLLMTNQIIKRPCGHTPRTQLLLSPSQLSGSVRRKITKTRHTKTEDSSFSSSSSPSYSSLLHLFPLSPLRLPSHTTPPPVGGAYGEWAGLHAPRDEEVWPLTLPNQLYRGAQLRPIISLEGRLSPPTQVKREIHPSIFTSRLSSRFTLVTDYRHRKEVIGGGKLSYGGALLLSTERMMDSNKQCDYVDRGDEDEKELEMKEGRKDKRPVASTPVPGSPWCVVWTGDDRVFFFNPTIHLSVWERPGELIGRDISHIIEDPPHKRKKTPVDRNSSYQSPGLHGIDEGDDDEHEHNSKRNKTEEPISLLPRPGEVQHLPQELRIDHFRKMMLERGVSAFSTWEKELHKMVFDPRYLLLTSEQRKQVFDQFVKSRMKDEYKENRSKLQKARDEFRCLLEEAKMSDRMTFKEFCIRYRGDQRFSALNRKKEQEVLFNHYITSLKKRDKEKRARLRKMR